MIIKINTENQQELIKGMAVLTLLLESEKDTEVNPQATVGPKVNRKAVTNSEGGIEVVETPVVEAAPKKTATLKKAAASAVIEEDKPSFDLMKKEIAEIMTANKTREGFMESMVEFRQNLNITGLALLKPEHETATWEFLKKLRAMAEED